MGTRHVATVVLVVVCSALLSCSKTANSPTAPSSTSADLQPAPSTIYYLHVDSSNLEEDVDSLGHYLYKSTTSVRNYGATDVTVTNYQVQVLWSSTIAATKSTAPYVSVPAYSSRSIVFTFTSAVRLYGQSVVTYNVKVGYKDKYGNTGSVSATYINDGCPGCWDY